ncbi:glycoside hydrolase family 10 protein [Kitasatospora sp. NPDC059571]|uniref:glycoside hydrolase family 10 protein n=1 Tax=Kitasatospora sp. NPDC059571 TaxID=3346871 RepID=UPI0036C02F04
MGRGGSGGGIKYPRGGPPPGGFVGGAVLDAVARYPVDGVHFDDYFYPYPSGGRDFPDDRTFAAYGAGFTDRAAWRRHNVDLLIREVRDLVRAARPDAAFGVSPFGVWRNASTDPAGSATTAFQSYDGIHANSLGWVRRGLLDYVAPQLYWPIGHPLADYAVLARWWAERTAGSGTQLWIGQAAYRAGAPAQGPAWQDPAELSRHLALNAALPAIGGDLLFSAGDVTADRLGAITRLHEDHWRRPALVPLLPRLAAGPAPARPVLLRDTAGLRVRASGPAFVLALRRHERPGAPGELVAVRPAAEPLFTPAAGSWYTATALDRAGRESPPSAPLAF